MRKFLQFFMAVTIMVAAGACSKEDSVGPDSDVIWDIYPAGVYIQLLDDEGDNLLDPSVNGNWVGEPMSIAYEDKAYDAIWNREDIQPKTRAYMPHFFGTLWTGAWSNEFYYLYFGEFAGNKNHDLKLTFGIQAINTVFEFEYVSKFSWKNKEPHREAYIMYKGKKIDGEILTLTLPKKQ